jgi:hypothetical protein
MLISRAELVKFIEFIDRVGAIGITIEIGGTDDTES